MSNYILIHNNNIKLNIIDNKLCLTILSENVTTKDYLELLNELEIFFNNTKNNKNNNKFYFIVDISQTTIMNITNIFDYVYKFTLFFKKHDLFLQNHLYGTIIIMTSKINKVIFDYLLSFYKPTRPYKFYKNYNEIVYDF